MSDMPNLDQVRVQKIKIILLLPVAILGVMLILYVSRFGLGMTGDSVHYLMGAENIYAGDGFGRSAADDTIRPITMFAPLFSTVISGWGWVGSIFEGARFLQALLFGANIVLVGYLILRHTESIWAMLAGALIILVSENVLLFHAWLMPEALFIFLMLLCISMLIRYLAQDRFSSLILTAAVAGMATLTRYVGISLIALALISILLIPRINWKRRLRDVMVVAGFGLGPIGLWMIRNVAVAGDIVNRAIRYHPVPVELIRAYRAEISFWFVPEQLGLRHSIRKLLMILVGFVAPSAYYLMELRDTFARKPVDRGQFLTLPWVLLIYAVVYIGTFVINLTYLDAFIDFDTVGRYLTPLYVIGVIIFVIVFHGLARRVGSWWPLRAVVAAIGISLVVLYALNSLTLVQDPIPFMGYTGLKVERGETVERLERLNRSAPIISNDPELIYILSDRAAYMMPIHYDANTGEERGDFEAQIEATRTKLKDGGMLVLFSPINDAVIEVIDLLQVELIDSFYGSLFYAYPQVLDE